MHRYRATLAYDGTAYWGWQKNSHHTPTIQGALSAAIAQLSPTAPLPEAASRTDRGVHAEGQVVAIDLEKAWNPSTLQRALNAHLPRDIRITTLIPTHSTFHPTLDAQWKEYRYRISFGPVQDPSERHFFYSFPYHLDLLKMEKGALLLLGTKDFSALGNGPAKNPICTIQQIDLILLSGNRLEIVIRGNRFLYKMARNIGGLLLAIGRGKWPTDAIPKLLNDKKRSAAAIPLMTQELAFGPRQSAQNRSEERYMTAPAHGLTLTKVQYD